MGGKFEAFGRNYWDHEVIITIYQEVQMLIFNDIDIISGAHNHHLRGLGTLGKDSSHLGLDTTQDSL